MYNTIEEFNSYMSKEQKNNPKEFDAKIGTMQQRAKDRHLFMSKKTTEQILDERNFWIAIKGKRTKSVRDRITRLESVLVARYDRDKREKERIAKQAEG